MDTARNLTQPKVADWIFRQMGTETEDARTEGWLFMASPWPVLTITAAYLLICSTGPKIMSNYKAWDLRNFTIAYNFSLVLLSLYMFIEILLVTVFNPRFNNLGCAPVDYSDEPKARRLLSVLWLYFFSKFIELIETLVFIFRKKYGQITFLHVYHHSTMFVLWWLTVKHCGGGSAYFPAIMNSLVHVAMYTYYMLSAMGDNMKPYLWWKRYLTQLQQIQFWIVTAHISYTLYAGCGFPTGYAWALLLYMITMKILFLNFYLKTYKNTKNTSCFPGSSSITLVHHKQD